MKEVLELRVNRKFAHLLFSPKEGRKMGDMVVLVTLTRDDPRYAQLPKVRADVERKYNESFFWGWRIQRSYTKQELENARLFYVWPRTTFEPAGEECGTVYDESTACQVCGGGATRLGPLRLRRRSIPKIDIAETIASEIVVSEALVKAAKEHRIRGLGLEPVVFRSGAAGDQGYYDLRSSAPRLDLTRETLVGAGPFNLSTKSGEEVYKCPKRDNIGLNLISELYVADVPFLESWDYFETAQRMGVRRGLLRPATRALCSPRFRKMVLEEKLRGFQFEIAHVTT